MLNVMWWKTACLKLTGSIPLTTLVDTVNITAYAGAVWGEYDLSGRDYCITWSVESSGDFDEWLEEQGYRRKSGDD